MDAKQEATFFEELDMLASIQQHYSKQLTPLPLSENDPDVKQLIQAMASFMAKARIAGKTQIDQLHTRVFKQLLSYLASPVPSMALIQAHTRALTEPTLLPKGTIFTLDTGEDEQASYQSLCEHTLYPIHIEKTGFTKQSSSSDTGPAQMILALQCRTGYSGEITQLPIHLNLHNHYKQTLALKYFLSNSLYKVNAVFDDAHTVDVDFTLNCKQQPIVSEIENTSNPTIENTVLSEHPAYSERQFFQLPESENYLTLTFVNAPTSWHSCKLSLDFTQPWPRTLGVSLETFQLNIIPVINLCQGQASPIQYNGTQSRVAVQPPSAAPELVFLRNLGVYSLQGKQRTALHPGVLKDGDGSYEFHQEVAKDKNHIGSCWLEINLPDAFTKPVKIIVDALWYQPSFSKVLWKNLTVYPSLIDIAGVTWHLYQTPRPHRENRHFSPQQLLDLSVLKNKALLTLHDILFVLDGFSTVFIDEFREIRPLFKDVHVEHCTVLNQQHISVPASRYIFSFHPFTTEMIPLLDTFLLHLQHILNLWSPDRQIGVCTKDIIQTNDSLSTQYLQSRPIQNQLIDKSITASSTGGEHYVL